MPDWLQPPNLPWYIWFGLGAFMYPVMRRVILQVFRQKLREPQRLTEPRPLPPIRPSQELVDGIIQQRNRESMEQTIATLKNHPPEARTVWQRIQSDE